MKTLAVALLLTVPLLVGPASVGAAGTDASAIASFLSIGLANAPTKFSLTVLAQTSTFYTPPKLIQQGTSNKPVVGTGVVTLKVVRPQRRDERRRHGPEVRTNHGDDSTAVDIAKTSTYKPSGAFAIGEAVTLPSHPSQDEHGLLQRIVY